MKCWRSYTVLAVTNRKTLLKLGCEILIVITFSVEREKQLEPCAGEAKPLKVVSDR
jgi:hypothetical protein